jgi:hypothetical protein
MNRLKIEELKEIEEDVHKYRHDCLTAVGEEQVKGASLRGNAREVSLAIHAMENEERAESKSKILHENRQEEAAMALYVRSLSMKRHTFNTLRTRVKRQRAINDFSIMREERESFEYLSSAFVAWVKKVEVEKRGRALTLWTQRENTLRQIFKIWQGSHLIRVQSKMMVFRYLKARSLEWVRALRAMVRKKKKRAVHRHRQRGTALCFFVRLIFRSWKGLAVRNRPDPLRVAANTVCAVQFIKRRIFYAWAEITALNSRRRSKVILDLQKHQRLPTLHYYMCEWHNIANFTRRKYYTSCSKALTKLSYYTIRSQYIKRETQSVTILHWAARARKFLHLLRSQTVRNIRLNSAMNTTHDKKMRRTFFKFWRHWRKVLKLYLHVPRNQGPRSIGDLGLSARTIQRDLVHTSLEWEKVLRPVDPTGNEYSRNQNLNSMGVVDKGRKADRRLNIRESDSEKENINVNASVSVTRFDTPLSKDTLRGPLHCSSTEVSSAIFRRLEAMREKEMRQRDLNYPDEEEEEDDDDDGNEHFTAAFLRKRRLIRSIKRWVKKVIRKRHHCICTEKVQYILCKRRMRSFLTAASSVWIRAVLRRIGDMEGIQEAAARIRPAYPSSTGGPTSDMIDSDRDRDRGKWSGISRESGRGSGRDRQTPP